MKRWNGWGDMHVDAHLPPSAEALLAQLIGPGSPRPERDLAEALTAVPTTRLPAHPLVETDAELRLRHALGQSLPDWVALRDGPIDTFPDAVARPTNEDELRAVLAFAKENDARIVPYGGGTSVVGHLTPPKGEPPVLTLSLARLNGLIQLDETSRLATFGAGVAGPDLEAALRAHGYTLGHYPQSFEYATLGGWIAARSSGQESLGYGRIEDLFAGGRVYTPSGDLHLPPHPASAAGPDLRQLVLGSEGRMGVISQATVRVTDLPEADPIHAVFFPDWERAIDAVRHISQAELPMSMMRLSNAIETRTNLALAGKETVVNALQTYLRLRGVGEDGCMLLLGFKGSRAVVNTARRKALSLCRAQRGVHVHRPLGSAWRKKRFKAPYLRNALWRAGYAVDTLETAVTWSQTTAAMQAMEQALSTALQEEGERVHVFTHLSHFYTSGSSIYTTYLFRLGPDAAATLGRWNALKSAASNALQAHGGTISHQHGVGLDHKKYLPNEKGELGVRILNRVFDEFDPKGVMNPGKLVD